MSERKIKYQNHVEVSEGDTKLVSSVLCPLNENEIDDNQLFKNNDDEDIVMCIIENQSLKDGACGVFCCPYFYGAVYPFKTNLVDCRNPKMSILCQKEK